MTTTSQNKLKSFDNHSVKQKSNVFTLFFLFFTLSVSLYSQSVSTFSPKTNNIPSSPEAALLGRFGDIPVGNYTGVANVSIPIYTIKESGIEIPINLKYHSSGVKVADEATWVGLGWDLSPGGAIIHEVRGKSDHQETIGNRLYDMPGYENFKNYFYTFASGKHTFRNQRGSALNNSCFEKDNNISDYNGYDSVEVLYKLLEGSGQPDIYNYDFAGYSGKFYIHPENQQIILLDKKENITFERLSDLTWLAKTQDGNVFKFGIIENADGGIDNEYKGRTYKLSNITCNNGKTINFNYIDEKHLQYKAVEYKCLFCLDNDGFTNSFSYINPYQYKKTLSKITTSDAIIDFNLEDREDIKSEIINTKAKRLKSIDITSLVTNKKTKSYDFVYSYFSYSTIGMPYYETSLNSYTNNNNSYLGKRLKLDFVKEIGYDTNGVRITTKPAYNFEYDLNNIMPLKNSCAVDFWGYYNGENNDKLLPNLDYFDYPYDARYQNLNNLFSYNYTGANRYTNNIFAGTNMLKKITYPTSGSTEFEYEPNSFTNQFIPDKSKRVYKNYYTSNTSVNVGSNIYFKLSKSATIHFENRIDNGVANQAGLPALTLSQMAGCSIKLSKYKVSAGIVQITPIKQWDLSSVLNADFIQNGGKVWVDDFRINFDPDPDPTFKYQVSVTFPDNLKNPGYNSMAGVSSRVTFYDDTDVDTTISSQCGMRIKTIKNYDRTGNLIGSKLFKYSDGKLLNKFEPLTVSQAQHTNCIRSNVAGKQFWDAWVTYYNRINISSDDFGIDGGNIIGYGKVEEIDLDKNNISNGKIVYNYINEINETKKGLPNIPYQKNGLILSETIYDKTDKKLTEKNHSYTSISPLNIYFGVKIYNQSFGNAEVGNLIPISKISHIPNPIPTMTSPYVPEGLNHKYNFKTYPIISECWMLDNIITKQYNNSNSIITRENYTYTTDGKIRSTEIINSINEPLITKKYYSDDTIINNSQMTNSMSSSGMLGIPVYTEQYSGAVLLSSEKTEYIATDGINGYNRPSMLPKYIFASKGANSLDRRLTYDKYDNKGNIQQYTIENGASVTILWGYGKTLPIAKIENASYASVAAALGITTAVLDTYNESQLVSINTLRGLLPNAMVSTYTHIPLVGVSTITDSKNDKTTYSYDAFGRLIYVKDKDGNILSENKYQYKN